MQGDWIGDTHISKSAQEWCHSPEYLNRSHTGVLTKNNLHKEYGQACKR